MSAYNIAFKGLSVGKHEYDFEIDSGFFELFEGRFVDNGNVKAKVIFIKGNTFHTIHFKITGSVLLTCDRCLELYNQPVHHETKVILKPGNEGSSDDDEIIWISPEEYQVNVAQLIYEFIVLSLPIRHVHPDDESGESSCNPEMLMKLRQYQKEDGEHPRDNRWDELTKLINNN